MAKPKDINLLELDLTREELDRELARAIQSAPKQDKFWAPNEDYILTKLTEAKVANSYIAEKMHRTPDAIYSRQKRLRWAKKLSPKSD